MIPAADKYLQRDILKGEMELSRFVVVDWVQWKWSITDIQKTILRAALQAITLGN
jgi:hypothetical protein